MGRRERFFGDGDAPMGGGGEGEVGLQIGCIQHK